MSWIELNELKFFSLVNPLFLWNGYQKPKHKPLKSRFQALADQFCLDNTKFVKGKSNPFMDWYQGFDIPLLFHLDVMYIHAYSCAVQTLWKSRLRMLHVWLLFLMENFHRYIQHCHFHGSLLYGVSWFLLQVLDHSQVMWSQSCIYSNRMLIERAFLCKSVHCHSKISILIKQLAASSNFWWGSES